ncbi:hypothetical protein PF005_g14861 [Phytophthora fragariae]|uniref:Uncharacterized protein n=1 Tax=Phytophthora fragariae TaxID=53985 RepID=A0A6A3RLZ9_9STRA|nr:hypothetical protein PF003_g26200 [Phytophthora fragariae]KAE8933250.1 hypothetical protein PF009_g16739 [Phytophthora fragariae]KAE9001274.1 hypothetical protein PF011_g13816 [Phytophthora fragariae]KAE9099946.1 hypothetical protein PF007_g15694 [Phytophthora fragariae]KAE9101196.1 hypothetical protein PF010_g14529 [Phytophthora fragariae]
MAGETEAKVAAVAPKDDGETKSPGGETELLALIRGITERMGRLEESQAMLEKTLEGDRVKLERKVDPILTPPMDTSLFASGLRRHVCLTASSLVNGIAHLGSKPVGTRRFRSALW